MHFSIDRTVHTTAFDKTVADHWLERKIAQTASGSTEKDRSDDRPLQRRTRYRLSYIPLPYTKLLTGQFYPHTHARARARTRTHTHTHGIPGAPEGILVCVEGGRGGGALANHGH